MTMTEKLTLKKLSGELEALRARVLELEQQLKHNLEATPGSSIESSKLPEHGASIATEHRQRLIALEAFLIAEQRGFQGGDPAQDWARAEQLVNDRLLQESTREQKAMRAKKPATKKVSAKSSSLTK
jgi:hypothetical protein